MLVKFTKLAKRRNSTKQPTEWLEHYDIKLKQPTSLESPAVIIKDFDASLNYAYFNNAYYFVNDVISINNELSEVQLEKDVLATYKYAINTYNAFVNRSDSDYDEELIDNEMSCRQKIKSITTREVSLSPIFDGVGCYIMRIACDSADSVSGIKTFVLTKAQVKNVLGFMFSQDVLDAVGDNLLKSTLNPFQYIVSLKFCAISYAHMSEGCPSEVVKFGWWSSGLSYKVLNYVGDKITFGINRPTRFYDDFRDFTQGYSSYELLLPASGLYNIPAYDFSFESFDMQLYVDVITGKSTWYMLASDSNALLHKFDANVCADVQISQTSYNLTSVVGGIASTAGNLISGNIVASASSAAGAIGALIQPSPSSRGTTGSIMELLSITSIAIYATHMDAIDDHPIGFGRPLNQNRTLGSLSGFVKCSGASISLDGHADDIDRVNAYLNSGFYIE